MNDNQKLIRENEQLISNTNILTESLTNEKMKLNQLAQYTPSSFIVELSGIHHQGGDDISDLISKVVEAAKITGYDPNQIDVAYRTSCRPTAPVIIMLDRKLEKNNFHRQKIKIKNIKSSVILNQSAVDQDEALVQNIYLNENFTQKNRNLLKKAKWEANKLKYRYPGYSVNGEI